MVLEPWEIFLSFFIHGHDTKCMHVHVRACTHTTLAFSRERIRLRARVAGCPVKSELQIINKQSFLRSVCAMQYLEHTSVVPTALSGHLSESGAHCSLGRVRCPGQASAICQVKNQSVQLCHGVDGRHKSAPVLCK